MTAGNEEPRTHNDQVLSELYAQVGDHYARRYAQQFDSEAGLARFTAWFHQHTAEVPEATEHPAANLRLRLSGWMRRWLQRAGQRVMRADDASAVQYGWQITARRAALGRSYRDPRFDMLVTCPVCAGSGRSGTYDPCPQCDGTGRVIRTASKGTAPSARPGGTRLS
jgi:DnaJ-class molecular chaperone